MNVEGGGFEADDEDGFAGAMAQIEQWSAASLRQVELVNTMQQSIEQVTASVWSPGREVCVTVDHSGQLSDIAFEDRALQTSPIALGRIVTMTIRRALAELQVKVAKVTREIAGEGSPMALAVENQYRASFERHVGALGGQSQGTRY